MVQVMISLSLMASWYITKVKFYLVMTSMEGGSRSPCSYIDLEYFLNIALRTLQERIDTKIFLNLMVEIELTSNAALAPS